MAPRRTWLVTTLIVSVAFLHSLRAQTPTPRAVTLAAGRTQLTGLEDEVPLTARVQWSSGPSTVESDRVRWESSNPDVVVVDQDGYAIATGFGSATVRAFFTANTVEVSDRIELSVTNDLTERIAWTRVHPFVVWADEAQSVTFEVHVARRADVASVTIVDLPVSASARRDVELYDDGTHGDRRAGDRTFTAENVLVFGTEQSTSIAEGLGYVGGDVRVTLRDGRRLQRTNGTYGPVSSDAWGQLKLVSKTLRNAFPARQLGDGIVVTPYAIFIEDAHRDIMPTIPFAPRGVAGKQTELYELSAARRVLRHFPDVFDFMLVTTAFQTVSGFTGPLGNPVPFFTGTYVPAQHIMPAFNETQQMNTLTSGSVERLKGVLVHNPHYPSIFDHEIAHAWSAFLNPAALRNGTVGAHWGPGTSFTGQLGGFVAANGTACNLTANGDGTFRCEKADSNAGPYAPLELYAMGLIPPEEVPPVHVLTNPNSTDLNRITAESVETYTIDDIMRLNGGPRSPGASESQRNFTLGVVVLSDEPLNDAGYAYFSGMARMLMRDGPPAPNTFLAPFRWATGNRASLTSVLGEFVERPCEFEVSPREVTAPAIGGQVRVEVVTEGRCGWIGTPDWKTSSWAASRSSPRNWGDGTMEFAVQPNTSAGARSGRLFVAGWPVQLTQPEK